MRSEKRYKETFNSKLSTNSELNHEKLRNFTLGQHSSLNDSSENKLANQNLV